MSQNVTKDIVVDITIYPLKFKFQNYVLSKVFLNCATIKGKDISLWAGLRSRRILSHSDSDLKISTPTPLRLRQDKKNSIIKKHHDVGTIFLLSAFDYIHMGGLAKQYPFVVAADAVGRGYRCSFGCGWYDSLWTSLHAHRTIAMALKLSPISFFRRNSITKCKWHLTLITTLPLTFSFWHSLLSGGCITVRPKSPRVDGW